MLRRRSIFGLGLVIAAGLFALGGGEARAQKQLSPIPDTWQLDVKFRDPQKLQLQLPGESSPATFWYIVFEVTNNTGMDVEFFPSGKLVTDTLQVVDAGVGVVPAVYDRIALLNRTDFPFFKPPTKISGTLLQGEENAIASAFVFRTFDRTASGFTIFLSGLSGDMKRIPNPVFDPGMGETEKNPRAFLLRRTLGIEYTLPGDASTQINATPIRRSKFWVMR